eukprot:scaffold153802_cov24-Prasinocladus_malaysianus.AAC.1
MLEDSGSKDNEPLAGEFEEGGGDGPDWWEQLVAAQAAAAASRNKFSRPGPTRQWCEAGWLGKPDQPPDMRQNTFWAGMCLQLAERVEAAAGDSSGKSSLLGRPLMSKQMLETFSGSNVSSHPS